MTPSVAAQRNPSSPIGAANAGIIKPWLQGALLVGSRLGLSRAFAPRITVLLYHRVVDAVFDNLTVGVAQFDRQMAFIRKHCDVLSIEEVLARKAIDAAERPLVAVTFDDGYADNYRNAVPILEQHRIPAAFFVSTGIVDSERRFSHDIRRGNPAIPVMTWDNLRDMRDRGFTIGSHTVTHIDCAKEPEAVVIEELARSQDDLVRELGHNSRIFAYPYGGRAHMTPERLELVKRAGYIGCLSAFGGSNIRRIDPYNVLRRAIHWEFSADAFQLVCRGIAWPW